MRGAWLLSGWVGVVMASGMSGQSAPQRLMVAEVWSSDGREWADQLSVVRGIGEGSGGALWISDRFPSRIVIVDGPFSDGSDVLREFTEGDGPGEIDGPTMFGSTPDGHIAVYDMGRVSIEVFASSGAYVKRVRLPVRVQWPKGFAVLASGDYVISGGVLGIDKAIHQFDQDGRLVASWGEVADADDYQASLIGTGGALQALPDGSLLYSQGAPHRVVRYVSEEGVGGVSWHAEVIAEFADMFPAPGDAVIEERVRDGVPYRGFDVRYPQSRAVFTFGDGSVLNVVVMRKEGRSVWQLLSAVPAGDGRERASQTPIAVAHVDEAYVPWFQSGSGEIWAHRRDTTTNVPTIVRLQVERVR